MCECGVIVCKADNDIAKRSEASHVRDVSDGVEGGADVCRKSASEGVAESVCVIGRRRQAGGRRVLARTGR